ncbi:MAG: hypothetical protein R3C20_05290 [Planctomycetaceae bacterium]
MMFRFFLGAVVLLLASPGRAADDRVEWVFQTQFGERQFVNAGDGQWILFFPNGSRTACVEVERTDEFVAVRNLETNNVHRLFADRGTVQKNSRGNFSKFADGQWIAPTAPDSSEYKVRLVYFVPKDREPIPGYEQRIQATMELALELFTNALRAAGAATDGPAFERDANGRLTVRLIRGEKNARDYSELPRKDSPNHAKFVAEAVEARMGDTRRYAVVIFSETWETGPSQKVFPGVTNVAVAKPPLGGRVVVTAWMLQDEFCAGSPDALRQQFFDRTPVVGRSTYGVATPNAAKGEFMEEAYGAIVHELGHLFGCWHHRSRETNIMGGGFRDIRWNVGLQRNPRKQAEFSRENTWLLMTSRFLNPQVDRTDNMQPEMESTLSVNRDKILVSMDIRDDKGLAFACVVDESAEDGLIMLDAQQLTKAEEKVHFRISKRELKSEASTLMLVAVDTGGNFRKISKSLPGAE